MDRLADMKAFVATADAGSFSCGCPPACDVSPGLVTD
jgi:hypothetical protein